ncbi:MAG: Ig-like domain-containing protein [Prevotellaceae bacterium]|jgi:uncharacterized protein (TIGR02145 family)|nr:Ig-like domain-containing protein [Prevotellaceae bacterium]
MKKIFLSIGLLLTVSMATVVFNSCGDDKDEPKKEVPTDPDDGTNPAIVVSSISLDKTSLTLSAGEDYTLKATVLPANATNKTIDWESSDNSKATVTKGKVTAVAVGTATITAKAGDKTATCLVTVTAAAEISIPTITTSIAKQITENSAVLGGEITNNGGSSITSRGVCYSETDPNPTISGSKAQISTTNNTFSFTLNGLTETTTYYVRAYATNSKGTGYGEVISFTTTEPVPVTGIVIGGITWAPKNIASPGVFATTEGSGGLLYQWNRKTGWNTTEYVIGPTLEDIHREWNTTPSTSSTWSSANNPCPAGWRVPTAQELETLKDHYKEYVYQNGTMGHTFGEGDAELFLPVPGWRFHTNQGMLIGGAIQNGTQSIYWSSTESTDYIYAYGLDLSKDGILVRGDINKATGASVRCVSK